MVLAQLNELVDRFLSQSDRWIMAVPILIGIGIGLYFAMPGEPPLIPVIGILIVSLVGVVVTHSSRSDHLGCWLAFLAVLLVFMGIAASSLRTQTVEGKLLHRELAVTEITGTIHSIERLESGDSVRVILDQLVIKRVPPAKTPARVRITLKDPLDRFQSGDRIRVLAQLHPPEGPSMPGAYDFARHAFFQGIGAYGFAFRSAELVAPAAASPAPWLSAESIRNSITQHVDHTLTDPQAPIIIALLTGERAAIDDTDWDALRNSGLAHLLAISGMNVDMVAAIVFFLVRFLLACVPVLRDRYPIKAMAAVAAFAATALYVWMIVPSVPTQRSLIMVGLVLLAVVLGRSPFSLRLMALVATLILLFWPEQLLGASFQLSFAAVLALVAAFEMGREPLVRWHAGSGLLRRAALYIAVVIATTIIATLATAPFALYNFQSLPVYGVVANALAVPLSSFYLMPLAILYYVLAPFGAGDFIVMALAWGVDALLGIAHTVAAWEYAVWTPAQMPLTAFMALVAAGLWFCTWRGGLRYGALVIGGVGIFLFMTHTSPDIVMAREGKLVFVRFQDGSAAVSDKRQRRLIADYASRLNVAPERIAAFPRSGSLKDLRCDPVGCVLERHGRRIAIPRHDEGRRIDDTYADTVLKTSKTESAVSLWVNADGRITDHATAPRGTRPWH